MFIKNFILLFERDLDRLAKEIESYSNERSMWIVEGKIVNSGGNLTLHLIGNLFQFIGKEIGGFEYLRDREFEFGGRDVPREFLLSEIRKCKHELVVSLEGMDDSLLNKDYPLEIFGKKMSHCYFLIHLYGHLNYHLGQINYHRRLLDS
jgi:hypothetical protein